MGESSLKEVLYLATPNRHSLKTAKFAPPPPRSEVILYGVEFQAKASLVEICTFFWGEMVHPNLFFSNQKIYVRVPCWFSGVHSDAMGFD